MSGAMSVDPADVLADHVVVILVEPQHPGNVGAAARAMKNFGLTRLVLVAPPAWDPDTARWMAPGCDDMLAQARIVATLDEALEGVHLAIASTARHRRQGQPVEGPDQVADRIFEEADHGRSVAILFGREDFGLATEDVIRCDSILRIPTPEHASLNLGQAVLLVCWTLFQSATARGARFEGRTLGGSRAQRSTARASRPSPRDAQADLRQIEPATDALVSLLERVGYLRGVQPDKVRLTGRQALQRARLALRHVEALRGMVARVEWALDHPDHDWKASRKDSAPDRSLD